MAFDEIGAGVGGSIETVVSGYGTGLLISGCSSSTLASKGDRLNNDSLILTEAIANHAGYTQWFGHPAPDTMRIKKMLSKWCSEFYTDTTERALFEKIEKTAFKLLAFSKARIPIKPDQPMFELVVCLKLYRCYDFGKVNNELHLEWTFSSSDGYEISCASARHLSNLNYLVGKLNGNHPRWKHVLFEENCIE